MVFRAEWWSGQLPRPEDLKAYNEIVPGCAEMLVQSLQAESQHRRDIEKDIVAANIEDMREERVERRRGQRFGLLIALVAIIASAWLTLAGYAITGGVLGGTTVVGLVVAFIVGKSGSEPPDEESNQI